MNYLEIVFRSNPNQICVCPLCHNPDAHTEIASGFAWRVFCPNCGRYDFTNYARSNKKLEEHIIKDPVFRQKIAKQLQERENKDLVYSITTSSYPSGLVYPPKKRRSYNGEK